MYTITSDMISCDIFNNIVKHKLNVILTLRPIYNLIIVFTLMNILASFLCVV